MRTVAIKHNPVPTTQVPPVGLEQESQDTGFKLKTASSAVQSAAFCPDQAQDLANTISELSATERAVIVRLLLKQGDEPA